MEAFLHRLMWFIVGCNVTAIELAYTPSDNCTATAARLWQADALALAGVAILIIGGALVQGWKGKRDG